MRYHMAGGLLLALLAGCTSTDPKSAANVVYKMPRTDVEAKLTVTLLQCSPVKVDADLDLVALARPDNKGPTYRVAGKELASRRIKRTFNFTVDENRVLRSVNSSVTERTPTIIASATKALLTLGSVGLVEGELPPRAEAPAGVECSEDATTAVNRVDGIKRRVDQLREELAQGDKATSQTARVQELNLLLQELAAIKTGQLTKEITVTIELDKPTSDASKARSDTPTDSAGKDAAEGEPVNFPVEELYSLFKVNDHSSKMLEEFLKVTWKAEPEGAAYAKVPLPSAQTMPLRECGYWAFVPNPANIEVTLTPDKPLAEVIKPVKEVLPLAQWSPPAELCLDAGIGEDRSTNLKFDQYGRTVEFQWTSEAQAAAIAGALPGMASDVTTFIKGQTSLAKDKAEIDRLETLQKLNKLRACQEILEQGGYECEPKK